MDRPPCCATGLLATSVERRGTCRASAQNPEGHPVLSVANPSIKYIPSVISSKEPKVANFNNTIQVSDVEMLEQFEGGVMTESEDNGLAIMFEADTDIETRLTGTLKAHHCLGAHW